MMNTTRPTAAACTGPLLRALGEMSEGQPGHQVHHSDVYPRVMVLMGIASLDQFGNEKGSGIPLVSRIIQYAYRDLRKDGVAPTKGKRGYWSLTEQGFAQYLELPPLIGEDAPPTTPLVAVTVEVGPGCPEGEYHPDPYIRSLAVEASPCCQYFSERSPLCKTCAIRSQCQNLKAARLSELATELAKEDEEAAAAAATEPAEPEPPIPPSPAEPMEGGSTLPYYTTAELRSLGVDQARSVRDYACARCGVIVKKGKWYYWMAATEDNPGGLFHPACLLKKD